MNEADYLRGVQDGLTQAAEVVERYRRALAHATEAERTLWDEGADDALAGAADMLRGAQIVEDY